MAQAVNRRGIGIRECDGMGWTGNNRVRGDEGNSYIEGRERGEEEREGERE